MTDAELEGLARQGMNIVRHQIATGGRCYLIGNYFSGDGLHHMTEVERMIEERLGEGWLNSGRAKDAAFHVLRMAVDFMPPEAVVIVMPANMFLPTDKLLALPHDEQRRILDAGHDRHHQAVAEGLLTIEDALTAVVQTRERVCLCNQDARGRKPPQASCGPQSGFGGRLKLFGEEGRDVQ